MLKLPSYRQTESATAALSDAPKAGWWRSLSRKPKVPQCYVGIDIGSDQVEVARMDVEFTDSQQPMWTWVSQYTFPLERPGKEFPMEQWVERVASRLTERLPRCADQTRPLTALSVPPSWVHYQTSPVEEIDQTHDQCHRIFESSLFQSKSHIAHWPIHGNTMHHQVAAVSQSATSRLAKAVSSVGYQVKSIIPPATAILRSSQALTGLRPAAVILFDSLVANIAISSGEDAGLCRSVPAPDNLRDQETCGITELNAWLEVVAAEFRSTIRFAQRLGYEAVADAPLLISGRYAGLPGIDEAVARLTNCPTASWATNCFDRPKTAPSSCQLDPRRGLSLSLAYTNCQMVTKETV